MPSTSSSSVSSDLASSTVITPSLPAFFMASARNLPISASPLEEMVQTRAISSFEDLLGVLGGFRCQETRLEGRGSPRATNRFQPPTESQGRMSVSPAELRAALLPLPLLEGAPFVRVRETLCGQTSVQCRCHGSSVERQ